jgi:hypothetical protein
MVTYMSNRSWLLLIYKVPPEPSARRVYVWRKLKRLGAVLLHDAVWVLPATDRTREQLLWLAAEITEMEGDAMVWEAQLATTGKEEILIQQFLAQVETAYQEILSEIPREAADLDSLSRRYQQTKMQDYFQSPLGIQVRNSLVAARGEESP